MARRNGGKPGGGPRSGRKLDSFMPQTVKCCNCGAKVERREALCDYRLKNEEGSYCRFCKKCESTFLKTVEMVDDPTGLIFPEGIEVELGEKDPFFKIKFYADKGELPSWKTIPHEEDTGLLVFVRRVGSYVKADKIGDKPKLTCKVRITKKSTRVAFAEPHFDAIKHEETERELPPECPLNKEQSEEIKEESE